MKRLGRFIASVCAAMTVLVALAAPTSAHWGPGELFTVPSEVGWGHLDFDTSTTAQDFWSGGGSSAINLATDANTSSHLRGLVRQISNPQSFLAVGALDLSGLSPYSYQQGGLIVCNVGDACEVETVYYSSAYGSWQLVVAYTPSPDTPGTGISNQVTYNGDNIWLEVAETNGTRFYDYSPDNRSWSTLYIEPDNVNIGSSPFWSGFYLNPDSRFGSAVQLWSWQTSGVDAAASRIPPRRPDPGPTPRVGQPGVTSGVGIKIGT